MNDEEKDAYRRSVSEELQVLTRQAYDQHYSNLAAEHRRFASELEHLQRHRENRLSALSEQQDS